MDLLSIYSKLLVRTPEEVVRKCSKEFASLEQTAKVLHFLLPYIDQISFRNYEEEQEVKAWLKDQGYISPDRQRKKYLVPRPRKVLNKGIKKYGKEKIN